MSDIASDNKLSADFGQRGVVVATTAAVNGDFYAVQCLTACTFTTFSESDADGSAMTGTEFAAGTVIYGKIKALVASSGMYRAYKR